MSKEKNKPEIGELYIGDTKKKINRCEHDKVYDRGTGNFHLMPEKEENDMDFGEARKEYKELLMEIYREYYFDKVKGEYERLREKERIDILEYLSKSEYLKNSGLHVVKNGTAGRGAYNYTANGNLPKAVDLTNWKWVEVKDNSGFECVVSLNMLDVDPRNGNIHSLYDRIGFQIKYDRLQIKKEWIATEFDLPLTQANKKEIANIICCLYTKLTEDNKKRIDKMFLEQIQSSCECKSKLYLRQV